MPAGTLRAYRASQESAASVSARATLAPRGVPFAQVDTASGSESITPLMRDIGARLAQLRGFAQGWDGGAAPSPNLPSTLHALRFVGLAEKHHLCPSRVLASAEGGIAIVFIHGAVSADVEFLNSGEQLGGLYPEDRPTEVWDADALGWDATVQKIRGFLH